MVAKQSEFFASTTDKIRTIDNADQSFLADARGGKN
jgi:hypothetical protein